MAGTLVITTLSDGTNSTSATNCIQGSAKAWVNFDGTVSTPTIRAQYNVSSVTKTTTGDYTINFTNALPDANYSISGTAQQSGLNGVARGLLAPWTTAPTTSALRIATGNTGTGTLFDGLYVCVAIHD